MNRGKNEDRIYTSPEAGKRTLFLKNKRSTVAPLGQTTGSRAGAILHTAEL